MLTILGSRYRLCDGLTRRSFLRIGAFSVGSLAGPGLLRADPSRSHKAVIMVFLPGGPSHLDTFDLKPQAPAEFRGEFKPIATKVPGVQISEHLPRLAAVMDKLVLLRALVGGVEDHASHLCLTGHSRLGPQPAGDWPSFGSVVSRLKGSVDHTVPPFIGLAAKMLHPPYNDPGPGFLGVRHTAFTPDGEGQANLVLKGITLEQLQERRQLVMAFDQLRRDLDARGSIDGMEAFHQQALNLITSAKLRDALDVSREPAPVRERYGRGDPSLVPGLNAAPRLTEQLLMARRLVEAGARCVTLAFGAWDWHERGFEGHKQQLPLFDQGLAALVDDLHQRGLDQDVAVVAWGEFGRTPRINKTAGRDHWPLVSCAVLAGGGLRTGQVLGATNRLGETAQDRPVHFQEVLATLYHHLGIDVSRITIPDFTGRPQYLLEKHGPIPELI